MDELPPPTPEPRVRLVLEVPLVVWIVAVVLMLALTWAAFVWADEKQAEGVDRRRALYGDPPISGSLPPAPPPR